MNQRYDGLQKAYNIVKMETGSVCSYVRFTGYFHNLSLLRTPAIVLDTEECFYTAVREEFRYWSQGKNVKTL